MCGRYVIVSKLEKIEKRFRVKTESPELFQQSFNVCPGDLVPVITCENPAMLQFYRFGLRPFWAKKPLLFINARSEGDFNAENDIRYRSKLGITDKPSFRKPIRSQRCIIPADAFIEGTEKEKLNKPFLVYPIHRENRPFAMAGIFDHWADPESGEILSSFSIITTTAGPLLRLLPHHRSPVILKNEEDEHTWLDKNSPLTEIENLMRPDESNWLNAYPISSEIKSPLRKDRQLIESVGERVLKEYDYVLHRDIELTGMGMTPSRKRKLDESK